MKRIVLSFIIYHLSCSIGMADTQKPWTFWYWMYGAVSETGIKADLQAMKDVGLGGCYLMPIRGTQEHPEYKGEAQQLTPTFWKMVDYALAQADSIGLEMGIHVCDGFALAGGPWIRPEESMQKIVFCDTIVCGGRQHFQMRKPHHYQDYYEDIAVYAVPVRGKMYDVRGKMLDYSPDVTINAKGVYCADKPCWLQYTFDEPTLVRNIEVEPSGTNIQCQRLKVRASDDGIVFYDVKQLTPPRQGWQNTGFNTTFSIPPTTARYFRFEWTPEGTEPGAEDLDAAKWKPVLRVKSIRLSSWPLLDNWEGKAGYVWRIAPNTPEEDIAKQEYLSKDDIIRTTVQGDSVTLTLPQGQWRILRMGHTSTGHTNATAGGGKGLECDKFSRQVVEKQIDSWFGQFMQRPHHSVIKYMHVDSWECGSQNWSKTFAKEFQKRRGYDILPLLPLYAGVPMVGGDEVLRDIRRTINELVNEVFFQTAVDKARQYGVQLSSESIAPTMVSDGMEHYKYADLPMGEFWLNSPTHDKPNDMLDAIHGGHVYGKNIIQAEGFTELRGIWDETPAMVKPLLDRNFALGINRLFFHVYTHNPWSDRKPGMTLDGIGLFFQRDQTWFPEAKGFVDYITRCQTLLQRGCPVVDIAVYCGDEMPCRALTPDRLVPMLPGLFGTERIASEKARLANHGLPMIESPVGVRHSAGIIDLKDWINPLNGYQYDSMNKDALLHQPFNYKVLVIPEGTRLSVEVQEKIQALKQKGVIIIDKPYQQDSIIGVPRDVKMNHGDGIAYAHRRDGHTDIYFLSNQTYREEPVLISFNVSGKQVVCYDAVTDQYSRPVSWERNGRTVVECGFPAAGCSVFILFCDKNQENWPLETSIVPPNDQFAASKRPVCSLQTLEKQRWSVTFRETGLILTGQELFDWSRHTDPRIRYFSGHTRYSTTFNYQQKPSGRSLLALPDVKDIAHVWVNGKDCGLAWTAPYAVDITTALKKGKNKLEIEVVNTWHNALRGADQGHAPYGGIWTNAKYRTKGDGLLPAGLLTPPIIETVTY